MNARFLLPYCLQLVESSTLEGTCGEEHCDIEMISAKGAEESTIYDDDQCNGCENASRTVRGIIIIHFLLCALQCLWVRQGMGHNFPMGHNISINNKRFIRGKIFFMNSRCSNAIKRGPLGILHYGVTPPSCSEHQSDMQTLLYMTLSLIWYVVNRQITSPVLCPYSLPQLL